MVLTSLLDRLSKRVQDLWNTKLDESVKLCHDALAGCPAYLYSSLMP